MSEMPGPPRLDRRGGRERRASGAVPALQAPRPQLMRGLGLYAALLGGVLLLLLVTVVLEDRALRASYDMMAESDAAASAALVEEAIGARMTAARALQAMVTPGAEHPADTARLRGVLTALTSGSEPLFDRVVVQDTAGAVLYDVRVRAGGDSMPAAPPPPTRDVMAPYVVPAGAGADAAIIVVPLQVDGVRAGTVSGIVDIAALTERVWREPGLRRRHLVVVADGDTLASRGDGGAANARRAAASVHVGAAPAWTIEVLHEGTPPGIRATLWLLGSSALVFLVLGLVRERRQADHVAERSAELERLSTELLRSNRAKSEFLANVSHELRTPLNAIVGFVELLRDGVYGELSPRQQNPVERIAGSATHLRHLVDQVLDIAKMAAGRLEVHVEPVALRPFVLNVASELESLAADKGIVLSLKVGSSLPRVRTDPSHLRQILVNLVGNAIKYTPPGGAVAIRTRVAGGASAAAWREATPYPGVRAGGADAAAPVRLADDDAASPTLAARSPDPARMWMALQVSDTGIGIAPEDHDRIFEEFEQVNAGPRGESMQRGTGLGLPISRRLARLIGGDVTVESELGKGATFTLWLPVDPVVPIASAVP